MIEVNNLVKNYGKYQAVRDISFKVEQGEVLGLLGPNGAGKSTTMNIITGYISATKGEVKIGGYDILKNPKEAKKRIGYLPEIPPLYVDMTVTEYLSFVADLKGIKKAEVKAMLNDIMDKVGIITVSGKLIKNLSKGFRQRVGLAQAMVGYPDVLILDEPMVGLDPKQIIEIRDLISELGKTHTIILSSHILSEISAVCNRVIIIHNGQIVASDTPNGLSANLSQNRYRVRLKGDENQVLEAFDKNEDVAFVQLAHSDEDGTCDIFLEGTNGVDVRETAFKVAAKHNFVLLLINSEKMTLEDVFLQVIGNERVETKISEAVENKNIEETPKQAANKNAEETSKEAEK